MIHLNRDIESTSIYRLAVNMRCFPCKGQIKSYLFSDLFQNRHFFFRQIFDLDLNAFISEHDEEIAVVGDRYRLAGVIVVDGIFIDKGIAVVSVFP